MTEAVAARFQLFANSAIERKQSELILHSSIFHLAGRLYTLPEIVDTPVANVVARLVLIISLLFAFRCVF